MRDYQQGKIYKIVCNVTGKVYYGSTIEPTVARRLSGHVAHLKRFNEGKTNSCASFEILKNDNYSIVLVELYPCNSKDELLMKERYWIENNECVNKNNPIQTKEERIEYKKQHQLNNIEQYENNKKKYYQEHKEEIQIYLKKYKKENQSDKKYYEKHKNKILEQQKQKITCDCGRIINSNHILRHKKSKIHNEIMLTLF